MKTFRFATLLFVWFLAAFAAAPTCALPLRIDITGVLEELSLDDRALVDGANLSFSLFLESSQAPSSTTIFNAGAINETTETLFSDIEYTLLIENRPGGLGNGGIDTPTANSSLAVRVSSITQSAISLISFGSVSFFNVGEPINPAYPNGPLGSGEEESWLFFLPAVSLPLGEVPVNLDFLANADLDLLAPLVAEFGLQGESSSGLYIYEDQTWDVAVTPLDQAIFEVALPSSFMLLGMGLLGMASISRRSILLITSQKSIGRRFLMV